jgi:ABC-type antimicrobial peptide transport system permease subunit
VIPRSENLRALLEAVRVYAATTALLVAIGLLAVAVPAIRALRIDPVDTLRWH